MYIAYYDSWGKKIKQIWVKKKLNMPIHATYTIRRKGKIQIKSKHGMIMPRYMCAHAEKHMYVKDCEYVNVCLYRSIGIIVR